MSVHFVRLKVGQCMYERLFRRIVNVDLERRGGGGGRKRRGDGL